MSLHAAAAGERLAIAGHLALRQDDGFPERFRTLVLLSPDEPAFWPHVTASPEFADGAPDPLDRWSRRVIGRIACDLGGKAVFPFGGPPWRPFIAWAGRTGRVFASPVGLQVHATAGLWFSVRGAVALAEDWPPDPAPNPCDTCAGQPCRTACPPRALTPAGYDLPACHAFLDRPEGADCLSGGCAVRRACPVGANARDPAQSAFHMKAFHPR